MRIVIVNNHGSCIGLVKSELLCDAAFATMIVGMNKNFQGVGVITEDMESASANDDARFLRGYLADGFCLGIEQLMGCLVLFLNTFQIDLFLLDFLIFRVFRFCFLTFSKGEKYKLISITARRPPFFIGVYA